MFQWWSSVNLHNWNTLEDHWIHKYTGMPLEPHWLMLTPSGVPVLICIVETHWNTTGRPLEDHLNHNGNTLATNKSFSSGIPVYAGVYVSGTQDCHWIATELPLAQVRDIWERACAYRCCTRESLVTQSVIRVGSSLFDRSMLLLFREPIMSPITVFTTVPNALLIKALLQST